MQVFHWILETLRNPGDLIAWGGYPALMAVIFLETGAMVFFLPGDSLLFVAGLFASRGDLDLAMLHILLVPMAVLGDGTSYLMGARTGPKIFNKPRTRLFNPDHVKTAHEFYERHGGKAIVLARFMPVVRTFVPVIAGVAQMRYRDFVIWNVLGGFFWISSMTVLGYLLGQNEWVAHNLEKMIIGIVLLSILPAIIGFIRERGSKSAPASVETTPASE